MTFFEGPTEFREWLEQNHESALELWVGFHKTHTGKPTLTWPESVDEALCFGWIDALRRSLGPDSYSIRFVPRKRTSTWSAVNLKRVDELMAEGRMRPAGIRAWELRAHSSRLGYTYDFPDFEFTGCHAETFMANREAWDFFQSQSPSYKKVASRWVLGAKRAETQEKRLKTLIEDSAAGRKIEQMTRYTKKWT